MLTGVSTLGALDWKMVFVFDEKSSFKMLELSFCSKLDWRFPWPLAKTAPTKMGALINSMNFFV